MADQIIITVTEQERRALDYFISFQPEHMTEAEALQVIVRDALISLGVLAWADEAEGA